jgi:hypothetical protein
MKRTSWGLSGRGDSGGVSGDIGGVSGDASGGDSGELAAEVRRISCNSGCERYASLG